MPLSLNIKDLDKVIAEIKAYPADIEKIINNEFKVFAVGTTNDAKINAPVDEGPLRESIQFEATNLRIAISVGVAYAAFLEFGTKAFALAYVSSLPAEWQQLAAEYKGSGGGGSFKELVIAITQWVARKGMDLKAAYPIAKKIIVKGIRQHPFLLPAFMKNKIELIENLKRQLNAK